MKFPNPFVSKRVEISTPPAQPKIPAPYTNMALMEKYGKEVADIARRHPHAFKGHGISYDEKTGEPYMFISLLKTYQGDISDIPGKLSGGLEVRVEYRGVPRG